VGRSRLARRILAAVLSLFGLLFVALGFWAVRVAEARVAEELDAAAARAARALEEMRVPPEHRRAVLPELARLLDAEIVVSGPGGSFATRAEWTPAEMALVRAGEVRIAGVDYESRARDAARRPERYYLLTRRDVVARRRADVLRPVAVAGAFGLVAAALLSLAVARSIARPVRALAETARRVAAGEFEGELAPRGPGEVGDLEEAFARMLRALREGEARVRESERLAALGRLASGIAHELRNPLTAVRIAVETALSADTDAGVRREAREVALAELERLERTLRELLDYARPRTPRMESLELGRLLAECAALLRPQCEHMRVRLEVDAPEGLLVRGDADRLKQAVLNLVLNGAQAQPGGGVVTLRARPNAIEVADRGPGIPPEARANLFQPFSTTRAAGIGLGLAVVKQVADEHGASIDVDSGPSGTTIALRFPS
jgi:signal transduction histidine kinase